MRPFTFMIAGGFAAFTTATTTACVADNCLRAIRASAFPTRLGTADCSSYFITTVTPATYTTTVTPTNTVTVFNNKRRRAAGAAPEPTLEARQVTVVPSAIPAYASPCSGSVRYSSACSCIGVTATTTTAPTPTYTATAVAATATVVDTHPSINFEGYGGGSCDEFPEGPGTFVAGECVSLPFQISLEDDAISPGTCADTSSCVLNLYPYGSNCNPASLERSVGTGAQCIYVGDAFFGQLVCPGC